MKEKTQFRNQSVRYLIYSPIFPGGRIIKNPLSLSRHDSPFQNPKNPKSLKYQFAPIPNLATTSATPSNPSFTPSPLYSTIIPILTRKPVLLLSSLLRLNIFGVLLVALSLVFDTSLRRWRSGRFFVFCGSHLFRLFGILSVGGDFVEFLVVVVDDMKLA